MPILVLSNPGLRPCPERYSITSSARSKIDCGTPEAVLIDKANPFAEAVVWYSPLIENKKWSGRYKIICFVPGSGA